MGIKKTVSASGLMCALLCLVLLPGAMAVDISECTTMSTQGETYVMTADIQNDSLPGFCMVISAPDITLDCAGHYMLSTSTTSGVYSNQLNTTIKNCNISMGIAAGGFGIHLKGANNSLVLNNTLDAQNSGLYLNSNDNVFIQGLTASLNSYIGIQLLGSSNISLVDVTANDNSQHGIYLSSSQLNNLTNAMFSGNNFHGIYLSASSGNILTNVTSQYSLYVGIQLDSGSDDNVITGSRIYSNNYDGISIKDADYNVFLNNDVWNCTSGGSYSCIVVDESDHNVFSGNKINMSAGSGVLIKSLGSSAQDNADHNVFRDTELLDISGTPVFIEDDGADSENLNNTFLNFTYASETVEPRSQLIRQWYYRANVSYPGGGSAANVTVLAFNASDVLFANLTSNGTGWTGIAILTEYENNGGTKQYYSDYTINASLKSYMPSSTSYNASASPNDLSASVVLGDLFHQSSSSAESDNTRGVAIADLDNDGYLDYIAGNNINNRIYLNDGSGGFSLHESSAESDNTNTIAIADLDNDGDPDYIAGNYNQPNRIYLNNGTGNFVLQDTKTETGNEDTTHIAIADLDNDGDLDLIVANSDVGIQVYVNDGLANFTSYQNISGGCTALAAGDFDNDGHTDFVKAGLQLSPTTTYFNNGSGYFTLGEQFPDTTLYTYDLAAGDLDNDGYLDIIEGNGNTAGNQHNRVFMNDGDGTFTASQNLGDSDTNSMNIADLNNDGYLDFISGNKGPERAHVYVNDGTGRFTFAENNSILAQTSDIAVADLDDDGDLDYIEGNSGLNYIYFNNRNDNDYLKFYVKGLGFAVNLDGVGTKVEAYDTNGMLLGFREVTGADTAQDGTIQLHFGVPADQAYVINITFITAKIVSCAIQAPDSFTVYENGSSTSGTCYVTDSPPEIVMMQPADGNVTRDIDIQFTCTVSDDTELASVSIYVWDSSDNIYYSDTKAVTGTQNQSSWMLLTMTPDTYKWNCLVYDNASKYRQQPQNYSLMVMVQSSLYVKLVLNNTDSLVYVPGVGELSSGDLGQQVHTSPPHYYLASYLGSVLTGLVFDMRIPTSIETGTNASEGTHYLMLGQDIEGSRVFLVHTLGDWRAIQNRIALVEAGRFLTNIMPSFSYGLGSKYSLDLVLGYSDIDLRGGMLLRKGNHKLVMENNGTEGGKPVVLVRRE